MRYAGVVERLEALGYNVRDEGDIQVRKGKLIIEQNNKLLNLDDIIKISTELGNTIENVVDLDRFPLVLGGDHSIAIGTLSGLAKRYKNLGVIWYDAHADLNTSETTPSGNIHGMPLAVVFRDWR